MQDTIIIIAVILFYICLLTDVPSRLIDAWRERHGSTSHDVVVQRVASPRVVVNLPEDAAPLETLTAMPGDTVVGGDRARLWWTVFQAVIDSGETVEWAVYAAGEAVEKAYGDL